MALLFGDKHMNHINPIFKLQEKGVRAISFQSRISPARPIFNDLKLLNLPKIFELRLLTFVFDSVKRTKPSYFHDFFLFSSSVHQYLTRHTSQGNHTCCKRTAYSTAWNTLVISALSFGIYYPLKSVMLHQHDSSKQSWKVTFWAKLTNELFVSFDIDLPQFILRLFYPIYLITT